MLPLSSTTNTISASPPRRSDPLHKESPSLSIRVTLEGTVTVVFLREARSRQRLNFPVTPETVVSRPARSHRLVGACAGAAPRAAKVNRTNPRNPAKRDPVL